MKKQRKDARKAEKKAERKLRKKQLKQQNASQRPMPNLKDKLEMILALLKQLYRHTNGKFRLHIRRMHIYVGSDNAADTAVLYGVAMATTSCILQWLQDHFIPIRHKKGSVEIYPDYLSEKTNIDIDIVCSVRIYRALAIGIRMLFAYDKENRRSYQKALRRAKAARAKQKKNKK